MSALTCVLSVDDVEGAVRRPSILEHFGQEHGASWDPFGGLHQVGVATHHTDGEHPERNHGREIERSNTSTHPDGQAVGVGVHVLGDGRQRLSQHQGCDAAGVFNHLCNDHINEDR